MQVTLGNDAGAWVTGAKRIEKWLIVNITCGNAGFCSHMLEYFASAVMIIFDWAMCLVA